MPPLRGSERGEVWDLRPVGLRPRLLYAAPTGLVIICRHYGASYYMPPLRGYLLYVATTGALRGFLFTLPRTERTLFYQQDFGQKHQEAQRQTPAPEPTAFHLLLQVLVERLVDITHHAAIPQVVVLNHLVQCIAAEERHLRFEA